MTYCKFLMIQAVFTKRKMSEDAHWGIQNISFCMEKPYSCPLNEFVCQKEVQHFLNPRLARKSARIPRNMYRTFLFSYCFGKKRYPTKTIVAFKIFLLCLKK